MTKYNVLIPKPSAKRMAANVEVIIKYHHGIDPNDDRLIQYDSTPQTYKLKEETKGFEFEIDDKYQWIHSCKVVNGFSFEVFAKYVNSTNTREEIKNLVPEKMI